MMRAIIIPSIDRLNQIPGDGGPVYTETDPERFIVEPWNAVSSLFIIIPAIIWLNRISKETKSYRFLLFCIPMMILGGLGSTLFHAFRVSSFFLVMDVLPPAVLSLSLSFFFWLKVMKKWWGALLVILLSQAPRALLWSSVPMATAINISYMITGIAAALPWLIILYRTSFHQWNYVVLTLVFFILALVFREADPYPVAFLSMGTHFLWHIFTGFGAYTLLSYLYGIRNRELMMKKTRVDNATDH